MSSEEHFNRTEFIKQAREECCKSLSGHSSYNRENTKENNHAKRVSTAVESSDFKVKFLMIRIVAAVILFICFVTAMELNLSYETFSSKQFVEQMQSSTLFDKAEDCISTIIHKSDMKTEELQKKNQ